MSVTDGRRHTEPCHYCGGDAGTIDHIVPRALGGKDGKYNLVPSCFPCNQAKDDRWPTHHCEQCDRARWIFLARNDTQSRGLLNRRREVLTRVARIRQRVRLHGPNPLYDASARRLLREVEAIERQLMSRGKRIKAAA